MITARTNNAHEVPQRDRTGVRLKFALAALATTQLMLVLDGAVVSIALPSMQVAFDLSDSALAWLNNGYVLAFGGLLLLGGRAGDLWGRRRVFLFGIAVFIGASLLGGFAVSGPMLICSRILQGVGAAFAAPTATALISTTFAAGAARTRAFAVSSAASGAGTAVGLIAGGLLTQAFSWRGVMFVNVPIGIFVLVVARRVLADSRGEPGRLDIIGAVLGTFGLTGLVYGISRAGEPGGWQEPLVWGGLLLAVAALMAFVFRQSRVPDPLLPLGIFRNRNRSGAYVVILLVGGSLSLTYFLSLQVQHVMGYGPFQAGLAFLPFAVGIAGGSWLAARLVRRLPPRAIIGTGLALAAIGVLFYRALTQDANYVTDLLGPMLVWSTGMGMTFVPLTLTVLAEVRRSETGIASAVMGTMQQIGGAIGLVVLVTMSTIVQEARMPSATHVLTATRSAVDEVAAAQALDAVVRGYSAAYTGSLVLLVAAAVATLVVITARRPAHVGDE